MPRVTTADQWQPRLLGLIAVSLVVLGIALVYAASSIHAVGLGQPGWYFAVKQLIAALIGAILLVTFARTDYHLWGSYWVAWSWIGVSLVLLIIVVLPFTHAVAPEINGARRWIRLGPFSMQPSEVATLAAVMWTAMIATKKEKLIRNFRRGVVPILIVLLTLTLLIVIQPDLSTAARLLLVGAIVAFVAGARIGHFLLLAFVGLPALGIAILAEPYRVTRIKQFVDSILVMLGFGEGATAEVGWQIEQSVIGIGSGGAFGVGFGEGMQKVGYLPHASSDFIFSTIGEEFGFVGVLVLLALYTSFVVLGFHFARTATDRFGTLLASGLTAMIGLTALLHITVTLQLMPTTGLPLPFLSYGGTHLLVSLVATGMLINIGKQRDRT